MPRKNTKTNSNESDGKEFFAAIAQIEKEKGIPAGYMMEKITQALASAYKRDHEGAGDNVTVEADEEAATVRMFVKKDVVEEVDNPCTEMSLQMAREKLPHAQLGDVIRIEVRTRDFGRIAAQTARQVIIQGMREAERGMIYDEFSSKEHEILTGVVTRVDPRSGAVSLRIGSGSSSEQMKRCVFWLTSPRDDTRMLPPGRPIFPVIDARIDVARQTCTLSCIWSSARPRIRQADFACA